MKTALVLEGGGTKGMYTAGVLDAFLARGIQVDAVIGVSAGALFGVNYLSGQNGRALRYNKKYNADPRYMGFLPLVTTGNIVSTAFAYEEVPHRLDPFDDETFKVNAEAVPFYAVVTDIATGEAEYKRIRSVFDQMDTLRASGSLPFVSRPVEIGGKKYLDGAIADSIPYQWIMQQGYDRVIVVLTKNRAFVRKPMSAGMTGLFYGRRYPELKRALDRRHVMYQAEMDGLWTLEKEGRALVICPEEPLAVGRMEKNADRLEAGYSLGSADGEKAAAAAMEFCR